MTEMNIETWLEDSADAPAAIVLREYLTPVEGKDGVLFPPTFAALENSKEFPGGYNINELGNGENVCLIDSVGSQANRIEPIFTAGEYAALVPQLVVEAGEKKVSVLEAGHRAGDAIVRCTELKDALQKAFEALKKGNAVPLAKLAPTSLVFGVWDSRDTQAKAPRLLAATIRAFNVAKLTRSAAYSPAIDYVKEDLLEEYEDNKGLKDLYSKQGFLQALSSWTHGGVIAKGDIRREVTLQLAALRLLRGTTDDETKKLRAYLLGLALVAFTKPAVGFLRQGCNLVLDGDKKPESKLVFPDGRREDFELTHEAALAFAKKAAATFGVGESKTVEFDTKLAKDETTGEGKKKRAPKKAKTE